MQLFQLKISIAVAILGITLINAARLPAPNTASDTSIFQQRPNLPFNISLESFTKAKELGAR